MHTQDCAEATFALREIGRRTVGSSVSITMYLRRRGARREDASVAAVRRMCNAPAELVAHGGGAGEHDDVQHGQQQHRRGDEEQVELVVLAEARPAESVRLEHECEQAV